jgi:hypothetical protein
LSWIEPRQTKLEEDLAYSLLGIFDVDLPLRYGEGKVKAFERLQIEIDKLDKCVQDVHITDPPDKRRIEDTQGGLLKDSNNGVTLSRAEHYGLKATQANSRRCCFVASSMS